MRATETCLAEIKLKPSACRNSHRISCRGVQSGRRPGWGNVAQPESALEVMVEAEFEKGSRHRRVAAAACRSSRAVCTSGKQRRQPREDAHSACNSQSALLLARLRLAASAATCSERKAASVAASIVTQASAQRRALSWRLT